MAAFPPDAVAEFKTLRDGIFLLTVSHGTPLGHLAVVYDGSEAAKAGVEAVFAAEESLSAVLAAVAPASTMELDMPGPGVRHIGGARPWARPSAVMVPTPNGTHPATEALMAALLGAIDEVPAGAVLAEWVDPEGRTTRLRRRGPDGVEITRDDDPVATFEAAELPHLIRGLGLAAGEASAPVGTTGIERATRVVLARLYAVYPEGLDVAEIEAQAIAAGLGPGLAEQALAELSASGRTESRGGIHVIAQSGDRR